ncbi:LysR family transcriptional regulator [Roseomonas terrae]|jgi:DNA-binding transcriptional LysR family regulator|uniref:LysR family transcriptional regulator n=1 Tax=Neoroseomonas terrae TaxID=424799 RepID=A0ABS5EGB3_9PROT|nr:LysR family transcriptional regulator [Neoroseomonas terrae]MBR0650068.1 LysR family transcriptional regulator [Neoroseomonas terrae]
MDRRCRRKPDGGAESEAMSIHLDMTTARLFVSVMEEGSISRAARREAIAPSAISKRISDLELRLGHVLLIRHAGGVELTTAGAAVLRRARNLVHEAGQLEAELRLLGSGVTGLVRIAAGETTLISPLPELLGTFLQSNPGIRVELDERLHAEVLRAVQEQAADIGVLPAESIPPDLWARPWHRDQLVAVMRPDHPLADYPGVTMAEMLDHDLIGQDRRAALGALLGRQSAALGRSIRSRASADGYDVVCRLAQHGLGIGIVAESSARLFIEEMGLVALPVLDAWARRQHRLCTRDPERLSPAARLLLDALLASAGHED